MHPSSWVTTVHSHRHLKICPIFEGYTVMLISQISSMQTIQPVWNLQAHTVHQHVTVVLNTEMYCSSILIGGSLVAKSCLTLATPWTIAHQAPLSMGFSSQEYWS